MTAPQLAAYRVLYPLAAAYAAAILPASVLTMTGVLDIPALRHPAAHAHEMLFGFALAVVAGNQLGSVTRPTLAALLVLWIAARVAFLYAPLSVPAIALDAAFAAMLAARVVPRLFGAAKKWRNRALPIVLAALCAAAAAWQFVASRGSPMAGGTLLQIAVALFAMLMLFMGGRIIAPAVAGQLHLQGIRLDARVQPRLEAALLACGGAFVVLLAAPELHALAGAAAAATGALALVRLARWRLWQLRGRSDLICLCAGYAWLGIGLLAFAGALVSGHHLTAAVHAITIGALGTLTFNVMAMFWLLKARNMLGEQVSIVAGTLLLAAATVLRAVGTFDAPIRLWFAAACWSGAYLTLLGIFGRNRTRRARMGEDRPA